MKKIVNALLLSLAASQASALAAESSIQANLEQCISLAQQDMSNEEILAMVKQALGQAADLDSLDCEIKKPDNENIILHIVGGVIVGISTVIVGFGIGSAIYYCFKEKRNQENLRTLKEEILRFKTDNLRRDTEDLRKDIDDLKKQQQSYYKYFDRSWAHANFGADHARSTGDQESSAQSEYEYPKGMW